MAQKISHLFGVGVFFLILSVTQIYAASVVPGTMTKGSYTTNNTCGSSQSQQYSPSGFGCGGQGSVKKPDTMNCGGSWTCGQYGNVFCPGSNTAPCGNTVYYTYAQPSGYLQFTNYFYANGAPSFGQSGFNRKITNTSGRQCTRWADGTMHTPPGLGGTSSCEQGNFNYYTGGSSGVCDKFGSTDNLITSFAQNSGITGSASPADGDASCTVDGLYATADDSGPITSVENVASVFNNDQDHWCNMDKYLSRGLYAGKVYGTADNPELTGCSYYKNLASHTNMGPSGKNPDLLENMEIKVDDVSGVSEIKIEIGANCSATYNLPTDVGSVIVSTTAASGVKAAYKNITLKYNTTSTNGGSGAPGQGLPSLLNRFGKTRLDECLTEGKNYIKITTKDNARSDADGVNYAPNTTIVNFSSSSKFIKVDNYGSKLNITGDAKNVAESNTTTAGFIGGITDEPDIKQWKNFTINGTLKSSDPFGNDVTDPGNPCPTFSGTTLTCTTGTRGAKPADSNIIWNAPGDVDPVTGKFTGYMCGGLGPIPDTNSCNWDCKPGFSYDENTKTCVKSTNLFILFDAGTPEATGPYAAKLTDDPGTSHGLLKHKDAVCPVIANASNTGSINYKYSAGANYLFPLDPPTPTFPVAESGPGVCSMSCNAGYYRTGDTCTKIQYRSRWCPLLTTTGPTLGYSAIDPNPGAVHDEPVCGVNGPNTIYPAGSVVKTTLVGGDYARCDSISNKDGADLSVPIPDSYCPSPNYCTAGGSIPCVIKDIPVPPSCSDGIQNQDETGKDCGGATCGACAVTGCMPDYVVSGNSCVERTYTYNLVSTQEGITFLASQISDGYYFDLKSYPYVGTWGSKWCELIQGEGESSIPTNTQSSFTITRAQLPSFPAPSQMNVVFKWYGGRANGSWNCNAHNDFAYFDIGTYVLAN